MKEDKHNDGSWLQDALQDVLKTYCEYNPAFWHRYPDTKSARGNYIKAQPGDFSLQVPVMNMLIECKSTVVNAKLLTLAHHGDVGKRQIAKHRLWHRSGHPTLYLFGVKNGKDGISYFEWHNGRNVVIKVNDPLIKGELKDLAASLPEVIQIIRAIMETTYATAL